MYPYWICLVTISLSVSLLAFVWALRNGQFSDQGRARYLPLSEEFPQQPVKHPSKLTLEAYTLLFIGILGSLGIVGSLVFSLWRVKKG
jgi:cbb3-type cytochrome oxidase maturation protein